MHNTPLLCQRVPEVWFRSIEDMQAMSSTPEGREAGRLLVEDEAKFCDFSRSERFLVGQDHAALERATGAGSLRQERADDLEVVLKVGGRGIARSLRRLRTQCVPDLVVLSANSLVVPRRWLRVQEPNIRLG